MAKVKTAMMKAAMSGLYHTGAHRLLAPYTQGIGVIFTLHHVRPEPEEPRAFAPNRILEVAPQFLDAVLDQVQEAGLDVISLDQAVQRLKEGDDRRFVCFTFDDGYRDNLEHAYPLFKRRNLPLTLYVPTDYPDGTGELWWLALEEIVARADEIELCRNGALWRLPLRPPRRRPAPMKRSIGGYARSTRRRSAGGARSRRALRHRHGSGLREILDGLGRDQDHGRRPARHHRRAHQRPFRHLQALGSTRPRRDGGRRRAHRAGAGIAPRSLRHSRMAIRAAPAHATSRSLARPASRPP